MDIARKLKSNTVCIFRHEFWTDFSCKINSRSNFCESVDFQKNAITSRLLKVFHGFGQDFSCIKFLVVSVFVMQKKRTF